MKNNTVAQESKVSIPSISIPTRSIWSLVGFIAICGFGYPLFVHFLGPGFHEISLYNKDNPMDVSTGMRLIWVPITTYIIMSTGICLLIDAFRRQGLRAFGEQGIFLGLTVGIFGGTIGGLTVGFIMEFPVNPIVSLTSGLFGGFVLSLVGGLIGEFLKK
jgi:hypothetical protein